MIALNLDAASTEHSIIKSYLEQNASEVLAEKINNGVKIIKDGRTLVSKKTLDTFWNYAGSEAQKLAAKGAKVKAVEHTTVFDWAIHYFEEDSLEGTLYNEDGTEYTPPKPAKPFAKSVGYQSPTIAPIAPKPKPMSFFDMMDASVTAVTETPLELVEPEIDEEIDEPEETELYETEEESCIEEVDAPNDDIFGDAPVVSPAPVLRQISDTKCVDEDGVVHEVRAEPIAPKANIAEPSIPDVLIKLFGSTLIAR